MAPGAPDHVRHDVAKAAMQSLTPTQVRCLHDLVILDRRLFFRYAEFAANGALV